MTNALTTVLTGSPSLGSGWSGAESNRSVLGLSALGFGAAMTVALEGMTATAVTPRTLVDGAATAAIPAEPAAEPTDLLATFVPQPELPTPDPVHPMLTGSTTGSATTALATTASPAGSTTSVGFRAEAPVEAAQSSSPGLTDDTKAALDSGQAPESLPVPMGHIPTAQIPTAQIPTAQLTVPIPTVSTPASATLPSNAAPAVRPVITPVSSPADASKPAIPTMPATMTTPTPAGDLRRSGAPTSMVTAVAEVGTAPASAATAAASASSAPSPTAAPASDAVLHSGSGASGLPAPVPPTPGAPPTPTITTPAAAPLPANAPTLSTQVAGPLFTLAAAGPGEHVLTINVTPDNLGPVTVRAHVSGDGIRVELFAPTDAARDSLRAILPDLRRDLAGSGMNSSLDLSSGNQPADDNEPRRDRPASDQRNGADRTPADPASARDAFPRANDGASTIDVFA